MKKKYLLSMAVVTVIIGTLLYFLEPDVATRIFKGKALGPATSKPASEHQGHGAPTAEPAPQKQGPEEVQPIEIPPEKQQLIGVQISEVSQKALQKTIRTVGRIEYDERRVATVTTKFEGWIEKLNVDYAGKYVKQGEPLCEIYSPEILATQKEFLNLLRWRAKPDNGTGKSEAERMLARDAESLLEGAKERLRLWDISDDQIKKIEETGKPMRTLVLYSPVSGYVTQKAVIQGARVMAGEKLFEVADFSVVWVVSDIYEYELPLLKPGETAAIFLSYFPGREFSSRIDYIYPALSGETRTAKVRFVIPNPGGQLKPQMFTTVLIKINLGKRLVIPEDAVIDTGTRQVVYRDKGEGYFEQREVTLGLQGDGMVEVIRGLKAGERVASSAAFLIDSEARLKGAVK